MSKIDYDPDFSPKQISYDIKDSETGITLKSHFSKLGNIAKQDIFRWKSNLSILKNNFKLD